MLIALQVLFWIVVILLIVVVLVLATPLRLQLSYSTDPFSRSRIDARPLGGFVGNIRVFDSTRKKDADKQNAPKIKKREPKARRTARASALLEFPTVIGRMVQAVHVEKLAVDGEFGLNDPADTGCLYGQLTPLIYATGGRVQLRPNFQSMCLRGTADAQLRVIPLALLWPIGGVLWRIFGPFK